MKKRLTIFSIVLVVISIVAQKIMAEIKVKEFAFCERIKNRKPVESKGIFASDVGRVYFWTNIYGAERPTQIKHIWYYRGSKMSEVTLDIKYPQYRTWSYKTIMPEWVGEWYVEIVDSEGNVLKKANFLFGIPKEELFLDSFQKNVYYRKIEIGKDGNIYIKTDNGGLVFSSDGNYLPELNIDNIQFDMRYYEPYHKKSQLPEWVDLDLDKEKLKYIVDLEYDKDGNIFFIYKNFAEEEILFGYTNEGKQLFLKKYWTWHFPRLVDLEVSEEGYIFLADGIDDTIKIFNNRGELIHSIKGNFKHEEADGLSGLNDIAIDKKGNIYAVDMYANQVKIFRLK